MTTPCANSHPDLSSGEVHVWTARLIDDRHATPDFLCQEELARAAQFAFERDRQRFIQAHGIVRQILATYVNSDAATLTFTRNPHGKPYIIRGAGDANLEFNVAHAGHYCALAIRLDHPIGIDIEQVRDLLPADDIPLSFFTPAESHVLADLEGPTRRDAFFALWTCKEALVKGLGISLAAHLSRIEFDFDPAGCPRLVAWDGDRSIARRWSVLRLALAPGYVAALATMHPIRSLALMDWNYGRGD
jgi:4'-phosphopantetheinyl transferase